MKVKYMLSIINLILVIIIVINYYHDEKDEKSKFVVNNISNQYYELEYENETILEFQLDSLKHLKNIVKDYKNTKQVLTFNSQGLVEAKYSIDSLSELIHGRAYEFNSNGFLKSAYTYNNGKRIKVAVLFYDSLDYVKEYLFYNETGDLYKKQLLDVHGNVVETK